MPRLAKTGSLTCAAETPFGLPSALRQGKGICLLIAGATVIVGIGIAWLWVYERRTGCILQGSTWDAGSIVTAGANDIWIEYGAGSGDIVSIYRDLDGDGLVDERLVFAGALIEVLRASRGDGILDMARDIDMPLEAARSLRSGCGKLPRYTREKLNALVRRRPKHGRYGLNNPPSDVSSRRESSAPQTHGD